jgi:hypothetical protein
MLRCNSALRSLVYTLWTTRFDVKKFKFFPRGTFVCLVWITEIKQIIALYSIMGLVFSAFAKLRKASVSFVMSVRLSAWPFKC